MTLEDIYGYFPELNWIADESLRKSCAETWLDAANQSGWAEKGLENCPVVIKGLNRACPETNISHTRSVTKLSRAIMDTLNECYPETGALDQDTVLAGAILHDVGKLFEYNLDENGPCSSAQANMFTHPCSGAFIAQNHNLPPAVVHTILAHSDLMSPGGAQAYQSRESLIVKYADCLCFFHLLKHYGP